MSLRVLVFDGDSPLASALELALARVGCDVVRQTERSSFMAAAIAKAPALMIFAHQPGRMESFSVCLAVRRDPSLAKVPTALVSTYPVEAEFEKHSGTTLRADAYVASVSSAEELVIRLRDLVPSLPLAPPSGPGIDIVEEGFAGDEDIDVDDDAHTVVGRIPLDLLKPIEPAVDSSSRPTLGLPSEVDADEGPALDLVDPIEVDEAVIALGTMPDPEELAAVELPKKAASIPPPMPAPSVPMVDAAEADAAAREVVALRAKLDEVVASQAHDRARADAAAADRDRELTLLKAQVAESDKQLDDLRAKLTAASKGQSNVSMKEFLDLREQIGKRDRELLQVREELTKKDRELFDERDRALALERGRAESDDVITDLTRAKAAAEDAKVQLETEAERLVARVRSAEAASEEHLGALAGERAKTVAVEEALAAVRTEKLAVEGALEATRAELAARLADAAEAHRAEVSAMQGELETLRDQASQHALAIANAEALVEARQVELTNLGAQKAAAEVEVARLREEAVSLAEAHSHDERALLDLRASLESARSAHETALAALRSDLGSKNDALEQEIEALRGGEALVRGERDRAVSESQELGAKLETAEAALRDAKVQAVAADEAVQQREGEAKALIENLNARLEEASGRAFSLEAEANGVRAELEAARAALAQERAVHGREAALRQEGLERARDALAVVLAEVDALPLGSRP